MKNQRWPGDYQTVPQEFRSSKAEEQAGMNDANASHGNDYIAKQEIPMFDAYEMAGLDPSWSNQLDTVGRQPHSREYLEQQDNLFRGRKALSTIDGQVIDYCEGIQFSGRP
jgi:hypothetical protein